MSNDIIDGVENLNVLKALLKARAVVPRYTKVAVSISGGSDSDIMLDMIEKVKGDTEVVYYFIDTGLEYQATKDHLYDLEYRYHINIERLKAKKSIPTAIREKGVPFISKQVSESIYYLQLRGFDFTDRSFDECYQEFPTIKRVLQWWCNEGKSEQFLISHNPFLKEFMLENPPDFNISAYCCELSKKRTAHDFVRDIGARLDCIGVRKAEGGLRATMYKSCWDEDHQSGIDRFRPIFWLTDEDKRYYETKFNITHSRCYTEWGFKRTGCVGCPFNKNVSKDLDIIAQYEPKMYKACMNIFGKSYEYTKRYRAFQAEMTARRKQGDQLSLVDLEKKLRAHYKQFSISITTRMPVAKCTRKPFLR